MQVGLLLSHSSPSSRISLPHIGMYTSGGSISVGSSFGSSCGSFGSSDSMFDSSCVVGSSGS